MNRLIDAGDARWHNVACGITADHRNIPLMQPFHAGGVEACRVARDVPRSLRCTTCPAARANENDVTAFDVHAAPLLPGIEIFRINGSAGLEIRDAPQYGNVHQYTPRENSALEVGNIKLTGARVRDRALRKAVIQVAVVKHVAERVHVRCAVAVIGNRIGIEIELAGDRVLSRGSHHVAPGRRIIDLFFRVRVALERNCEAVPHERKGGLAFRGCDQVDGADLIVLAPPAPVR